MTSANLLVRESRPRRTLDSRVHRNPPEGAVSIRQGQTQESSIRMSRRSRSSGCIRRLRHIGACGNIDALEYQDMLSDASGGQLIPVRTKGGAA